jgi:hypothetical protein
MSGASQGVLRVCPIPSGALLPFLPEYPPYDAEPVLLARVPERKIHFLIVSKAPGQFYHEYSEYTAARDYKA